MKVPLLFIVATLICLTVATYVPLPHYHADGMIHMDKH